MKNNMFAGLKMRASTRNRITANIEKSAETSAEYFANKWMPRIKKRYRKQAEDMVLFMTKPEAASLAEALVNITSIARKFSIKKESVSGPVDVAVISKSEGFIWVQRKYYFLSELNSRYFSNKFISTHTTKPRGQHA